MVPYFGIFLSLIMSLGLVSCGHPSANMMFNSSTGSYPVISDTAAASLANINDNSGLPTSSTVRIQMKSVASAKVHSIHLNALVLKAVEGDLRFVQVASCYVQGTGDAAASTIKVGDSKADHLSADGRNLRFDVDGSPELVQLLKAPFYIVVEMQGDRPVSGLNVSAEVTFKTQIQM